MLSPFGKRKKKKGRKWNVSSVSILLIVACHDSMNWCENLFKALLLFSIMLINSGLLNAWNYFPNILKHFLVYLCIYAIYICPEGSVSAHQQQIKCYIRLSSCQKQVLLIHEWKTWNWNYGGLNKIWRKMWILFKTLFHTKNHQGHCGFTHFIFEGWLWFSG